MLPQLKSGDIARRPLASIFIQQCRHRHQPQHRMITVQLLSDVINLGKLGTIQTVAPGRMRSILYPQGKAAYILKGVAPRLPPLVHRNGALLDEEDKAKFTSLQMRIEALPQIVFYKRLISSKHNTNLKSTGNNQSIYGSVTVDDVALRLQQNHNLTLTLPDVLMSFNADRHQDKIKSTGLATIFVRLRNGVTASIKILVEPEVDAEKKA